MAGLRAMANVGGHMAMIDWPGPSGTIGKTQKKMVAARNGFCMFGVVPNRQAMI
jgi:hypothetical protein